MVSRTSVTSETILTSTNSFNWSDAPSDHPKPIWKAMGVLWGGKAEILDPDTDYNRVNLEK
jgi:hypothetical protein